jgi:hypothetical protein
MRMAGGYGWAIFSKPKSQPLSPAPDQYGKGEKPGGPCATVDAVDVKTFRILDDP